MKNLTILLFCSNSKDSKTLKLFFEYIGHKVVIPKKLSDTFDVLDKVSVNLVFIEMLNGGAQKTRVLKDDYRYSTIPIIGFPGKQHPLAIPVGLDSVIAITKADHIIKSQSMNISLIKEAISFVINDRPNPSKENF